MTVRPRDRVRELLAQHPDGLDAHDVAGTLGVHVTTARFHLNNLVGEGAAVTESSAPDGVGRPRVIYRVMPSPPSDELLRLLLAELGTDETVREAAGARAGRLWARAHLPPRSVPPPDVPDAVVSVETILTRLGFRITAVTSAFGDHTITVCSCPLRAFAASNPAVVRGVLRGAVEQALTSSSAALADAYRVHAKPDADGDCELQLTLTAVGAPRLTN
ncbi:hypothetical protein [Gordonia shandongensis]|uniref:hypothetical protein n=1 Tax=Gordonia shandongensis TaxID=376351 RepID=UPI0004265DE9|nr:hypothetical protein [Gordonia shandongensis]